MTKTISVNEIKPVFVFNEEGHTAKIDLVIPSLKCKRISKEPKNALVMSNKLTDTSVDFVIQVQSKDSTDNEIVHYAFRIKRLPCKIDTAKSKIKFADKKVKIRLHKVSDESWAAYADRDYDISDVQ